MSADEVITVIIGICGYPITVGRVVELELYLGIIAEVILRTALRGLIRTRRNGSRPLNVSEYAVLVRDHVKVTSFGLPMSPYTGV